VPHEGPSLSLRPARERAGHPGVRLKDFRREAGIVIAESGQPPHVAPTQLGHSSVKTTEKYYAHYSPEFAVGRAREALENRGRGGRPDGRRTGGGAPSGGGVDNPRNPLPPSSWIFNGLEGRLEAAGGFEPPNKGFADLSLSHLGTPPRQVLDYQIKPGN
jgi:hypothetical protein